MSRIGRLPIDIPAGVDVKIDGQAVSVKGPKGELALVVAAPIEVKLEENQVLVTRPDDERASRSLHGLTRTLIANNIIGVTQGYSKSLEVVGTGYRVMARGTDIEFALGFSPPGIVTPPAAPPPPASSASRSRAYASPRARPSCRACSAASASPSCPLPRVG